MAWPKNQRHRRRRPVWCSSLRRHLDDTEVGVFGVADVAPSSGRTGRDNLAAGVDPIRALHAGGFLNPVGMTGRGFPLRHGQSVLDTKGRETQWLLRAAFEDGEMIINGAGFPKEFCVQSIPV